MNMKKKHKITLLVIGILLVLSLMLSSSYALWVFNVSQESTNVVQADCFELMLSDNNPIGLGASFPMRDSDGVKTTPYEFTIRNICNHPADFQINLETLNTSTIDESFIKADLNGYITEYNTAENVEPTIDGARSAVKLYEDTIVSNEEKTYNLRIWVNEIATQEDVENKSYASKISVKATIRKKYDVATLIKGEDFNTTLKLLSGDEEPTQDTKNTSIISIERSLTAPGEGINYVGISDVESSKPIYAWFDDGTIYIYSDSDKIYMNPNSTFMFINMSNVINLDLSYFDTSNVSDMFCMFANMNSLTNLDLSNFDTSKVTNMSNMFYGLSLESVDVSNFDTSNVTNMRTMFYKMVNLTNLDLSNFDTSKVTNMSAMFGYDENLINLNISNFDTSSVTDISRMFYYVSKITNIDVSHFDTSNVTSMNAMFYKMEKLSNLDVSNFNTSNVTDMSGMFSGMSSLTNLDVSNFDTSKVTNMLGMFSEDKSLTFLDVSNFDTSNVTDMAAMFSTMLKLSSLDVSNFDTSKVTNMSGMFYNMPKIISLNLENFNTSNVTDMTGMFAKDKSLTYLNVSNFDTSKVEDMGKMFSECSNIKILDLSSFDTSSLKAFSRMTVISYFVTSSSFTVPPVPFYGMTSLTTIYVGKNWDLSKIPADTAMFGLDAQLVGGSGTTFDANHTDIGYAHVDCPGNPGYFTYKGPLGDTAAYCDSIAPHVN